MDDLSELRAQLEIMNKNLVAIAKYLERLSDALSDISQILELRGGE
jgi:hypothetical protein